MDGVSRLIHAVLQMAGVDPAKMQELAAQIPDLQQNIPVFAKRVMDTVTAIQESQVRLEAKLDQILEALTAHNPEAITSQALPAAPPIMGEETNKPIPSDKELKLADKQA